MSKSHTLVKRTEYLIDDMGVKPEEIMLVTFTNKAANEIQQRIAKVTPDFYKMWIGTFHRNCTRILRMFGKYLNINNFSIIDTKDARNIIKKHMAACGEDTSLPNIKYYQTKISELKNNLIGKEQARNDVTINGNLAEIYAGYVDECWKHKTFDFDDLITYTILLLSSFKPVSDWVHNHIKYIMVDECQDTNSAQFVLIKLLIGNNNAMLVGDANQSIYGFRNARPEYLENFADTTPNTLKLKLEQNYRSTKNIIEAANNVVVHNDFGTKLEMFCANEEGEKIGTFRATDSYSESRWVVSEIMTRQKFLNQKYSDFAIIYRANFQSRLYEEELAKAGVPYVVFGSGSFYSRKEVKDLLAYCKLVINPMDTESFRRVLSTLRGVGKKTIENLIEYANNNKINFHMALEDYVSNHNTVIASNLQQVLDVINKKYTKCVDIVDNVFTETDYRTRVAIVGTDEAHDSIEIMDEFRSMIESIEERNKDKNVSLLEMLDEISLLTDAKGDSKANSNAVKLMTAHASKGLEFNTVFVVGAEEGLFPHANAIAMNSIPAIEEERRLFYVAMTRAEKKLYITSCKQKKSNTFSFSPVDESRFVSEIPAEYKETCF